MSSKLRTLYDKLYVGVEARILAFQEGSINKKLARTLPKVPQLDSQYKQVIRPYWKQFKVPVPRKIWYRLYCNEARPFRPEYIPDNLWFRDIVPHYNNLIFAKALQDKCLHSVLFPDIRRPVTRVKNIAGIFYDDQLNLLSPEEAVLRCQGHGRILIKPSVGSGQGHGIRFFDSESLSREDILALFRSYGENFIVQDKMGQHEVLAALNPNSLNTIRVVTFLHRGEVHILTAILRVGGGSNEVDNTSQGGYKSTIQPDGRLSRLGTSKINGRWEYVETYPNGVRFEDVVIPSYDRIKDLVCTQAARMAHFKIIGWDIAVAPDGEPVLVEYNVIPAQGHGTGGPIFGDMTDEVLEEVYGRR